MTDDRRLTGVYAPIVTPFRPADGEIDLPWLRQHIAYLAEHGCTGIIPCGTNGEAASLSVDERLQVTEAALDAARAFGMPVIVGTGASALPDAVTLTRHAFAHGAAAVLLMPPFYFKKPPDAGIVAWFRRVCDAAVPPRGRVLLYHIPQTTGVPISDGVLDALLASHGEVIYGVKDSTGDPAQLAHFRAAFPQLAYYAGNDHRVAEACVAGGAGSITAGANVFPDLVKAVQRAAWGGPFASEDANSSAGGPFASGGASSPAGGSFASEDVNSAAGGPFASGGASSAAGGPFASEDANSSAGGPFASEDANSAFGDARRSASSDADSGVEPAQAILSEARRLLESFPLQPATKAALADIAGLPETAVRPPQIELTASQRAELRGQLLARLPGWRADRRQTA